jgi:hypothetical protein
VVAMRYSRRWDYPQLRRRGLYVGPAHCTEYTDNGMKQLSVPEGWYYGTWNHGTRGEARAVGLVAKLTSSVASKSQAMAIGSVLRGSLDGN